MEVETDILVIGAGIAGTVATGQLVGRGAHITILDKARGVGGRMATRRLAAGRADHGAQFFTVRDPRFATWIDRWRSQELVFQWSTGWSDGSLAHTVPDGHARYAVRGGMAALVKQQVSELVGHGVSIITNARVTALSQTNHGWNARTENGDTWTARAVVLTLPVPQALALLDAGKTLLDTEERVVLNRVRYAPCLCSLIHIDGDVHLPDPGALQRPNGDVAWIADNRRKGISPEATVLTLHGGHLWSAANFAATDATLQADFQAALKPWLAPDVQIREIQIVRWRYALPLELFPQPFLHARALPFLYFGGDAFGAPRIEGAMLSGLTLGQALAGQIEALTERL